MKKDAKIFLKHIAESVEKMLEFTSGMDKDGFKNSVITQDAVMRRLEIIGEAAKNTPLDFQKKYPGIPWNEMAKTRDKLIHGYIARFNNTPRSTGLIAQEVAPVLPEAIIG